MLTRYLPVFDEGLQATNGRPYTICSDFHLISNQQKFENNYTISMNDVDVKSEIDFSKERIKPCLLIKSWEIHLCSRLVYKVYLHTIVH